MTQLILQNQALQVHVLPNAGGRIARLQVREHGLELLQPIDPAQTFDPLNWPKGGAYPLLPYSNRIADAQLHFGGQTHALPAHPQAAPHTLHGISHTLAWTVQTSSPTHAHLSVEYSGAHWPWPIRAEQHFTLEGTALKVRLVLTNLGETPMPGGLGLHPYFQAHPQMQVSFSSRRQWQITADYLASGAFTEQAVDQQLVAANWQTQPYAAYLSQWEGMARLDYPQGRLQLQADAPLSHLVVFAPAGAPYVCLEPVSHLANGFNLHPQLGDLTGLHTLQPGDSLTAHVAFEWNSRASPLD